MKKKYTKKKSPSFRFSLRDIIFIFCLLISYVVASAQITPAGIYLIKNVGSQKAMDVYLGSSVAGTQIWQYDVNLTNAQKFTFTDIGSGIYNIKTFAHLYLSLKYNPIIKTKGASAGDATSVGFRVLVQDSQYVYSIRCSLSAVASCPVDQQWKLISLGSNTYLIESVAFPGKVLQPFDYNSQSSILLADKDSSNDQKWIIDTLRKRPDQANADLGYGPLNINLGDHTPDWLPDFFVSFDEGDFKVVDGKVDVNDVCPQHRSVGETGALNMPKASYEILEGTVVPKEAGISTDDFPTSHYTHDFCYKIRPDLEYNYLLGARYKLDYPAGSPCIALENQLTVLKNAYQHAATDAARKIILDKIIALSPRIVACRKTKVLIADNFQNIMEVEWESGLAQNGAYDNPAVPNNILGNSAGFFTAGHQLKDVMWNWPTVDDRVHVEGIWIWDRGHDAPTEIHPPHFVAVQRKLPVSLIIDASGKPVIRNQPDDRFIATRTDVFASADGTAMWNSKGLQPFAQTVDMKRKDYTFFIRHPFQRPPAGKLDSIFLQCKYLKQKGDNFPAEPVIKIENGIVRVTVPWHSANVSNDAIFARTFVVYWDDAQRFNNLPVTKVIESEKPKLYQVDIIKVNLVTRMDGSGNANSGPGNHGFGDFRIFCNVGSDWIFLNEFDPKININNILESGLGKALNTSTFQINKRFYVYVKNDPANAFRISTKGWEADAVNGLMGHIVNEYSRDGEVLNKFFGERLLAIYNYGENDDGIGSIDQMFTPSNMGPLNIPYTLRSYDGTGRNIYNIVYEITEIDYSSIFTPPTTVLNNLKKPVIGRQ